MRLEAEYSVPKITKIGSSCFVVIEGNIADNFLRHKINIFQFLRSLPTQSSVIRIKLQQLPPKVMQWLLDELKASHSHSFSY